LEEEAGGLEGPIAHPREAAGLEVAPELDADEKKATDSGWFLRSHSQALGSVSSTVCSVLFSNLIFQIKLSGPGLYGFCSRVEGFCKGHGPYTGQEQYIGERHISHAIGITSGSGLPSSASMTSCI